MFRRKRSAEEAPPPAQTDMPAPGPAVGSNGYVVTELPTYHSGKRRVVVYSSDPEGRIVKRFKK